MDTLNKMTIKAVTTNAVTVLASLVVKTNNCLDTFKVSDIRALHATRLDTMMCFNELSSLGLFYTVSNKAPKSYGETNEQRYLLNPKRCSELLINYKPEMIIGKRFYKVNIGPRTIFGGFIEDESDLYEQIKLLSLRVLGKEVSGVSHNDVIAVEVTGLESRLNYTDRWLESFNRPISETDYKYDSSFDDALIKSLMESYKPSFDGLAETSEDVKKTSGEGVNTIYLETDPKYSIFGAVKNKYEWQTSPDQFKHFSEV